MTGMIGADPQELKDLARTMDAGAKTLDVAKMRLKSSFQNIKWNGDDAQRAKSNFAGTHVPQLSRVADMLRETAAELRKDAQEQVTASAAGGGLRVMPLPVNILPDVKNGHGLLGPIARALPLIIDADDLADIREGLHALPDHVNDFRGPPVSIDNLTQAPVHEDYSGPESE